jgi:hypothetical protein
MPKPNAHETIEAPDGENRLVLLYVSMDVPGWPPDSAADFHSLRWEVKSAAGWETKIELGYPELDKVLGDQALISRLHSFSPETGRAVVLFSTTGPKDSFGGEWCLYTWRDWDLLNNREHRFIEISEDIFSPPQDKFAAKCEADAIIQQKQIAEQVGAGQPATRSELDSEGSDKPQPESEGRSR